MSMSEIVVEIAGVPFYCEVAYEIDDNEIVVMGINSDLIDLSALLQCGSFRDSVLSLLINSLRDKDDD